jgi:nucleoside-diphosphate-sugar epimerase
MKIAVTGGAGFIGSHLTAALVEAGHSVTVFDNLSTGNADNLAGLPVSFIKGDLADFELLKQAATGCELVYHQAAMVSVPRSMAEPTLNHQSNVTGVFNLFEAARQTGVKRVVYASSAAVYGAEPSLPKTESSVIAPLSPYGAAKYMAEIYAAAYAAAYPGLEFVGLRYMNVFGPRQDPASPYSGVLSIFCQAALRGQTCTILGDGEQTRDFVYVSDVVQANLLAGLKPLPQPVAVFNVGRGQQTSLNQIVALLSEINSTPLHYVYGIARHGDIRHSVADISLIAQVLGYNPQVSLREGLEQTLRWFQAMV